MAKKAVPPGRTHCLALERSRVLRYDTCHAHGEKMLGRRAFWLVLGSWLLTGATSFETLIDLPYFIRFPAACLFAVVGMVTLAVSLPTSSSRTKRRRAFIFLFYCTVYILMALLAVLLLNVCLTFHSLTIEEHSCGRAQCIEIAPPRQGSVTCEIILPGEVTSRCMPYDPAPEIANVSQVNWNTGSPLMRIEDFRFPQKVGLRCSPSVNCSNLRPGPGVEFISAVRLNFYKTIRYCFGGALWLIAVLITVIRWKKLRP